MTPHAAYMQTLGIETLNARYHLQAANAQQLSERLEAYVGSEAWNDLKTVNYLGLQSHQYHAAAKRQFGDTYGAMLTIDLTDEQTCYRFINSLRLIHRATNLFDNKTLAIHPYSTIFGNFSAEEKAKMDVKPTTIRISVGLENVDDLFEDIQQALLLS